MKLPFLSNRKRDSRRKIMQLREEINDKDEEISALKEQNKELEYKDRMLFLIKYNTIKL